MDILSSILSSLKFEQLNITDFQFRAPWGISTDGFGPGFSLIIREGNCWVSFDRSERIQMFAGQSIIVPRGGHIEFASSPTGHTDNLIHVWGHDRYMGFEEVPPAATFQKLWGGDGDLCHILGFAFQIRSTTDDDFHHKLPSFMWIENQDPQTTKIIDALADYLVDHTRDEPHISSGAFAQKARLAEAIVIGLIRDFLLSQDNKSGWISGLTNPKIGRAMSAIHDHFDQAWTVEKLAYKAGMSRAVFAKTFKNLTGDTPIEYLNRWRINVACRRLKERKLSVGQISALVGYNSELAFRRNFKAVTDETPHKWRQKNAI